MQAIKTGGAVLALLLFLGGCESYDAHYQYLLGKEIDGEAIDHNASIHIVDPEPAAAENTDISISGDTAVGAIERYRGGEVIEPEAVSIDTGS